MGRPFLLDFHIEPVLTRRDMVNHVLSIAGRGHGLPCPYGEKSIR